MKSLPYKQTPRIYLGYVRAFLYNTADHGAIRKVKWLKSVSRKGNKKKVCHVGSGGRIYQLPNFRGVRQGVICWLCVVTCNV